MRKPILALGLAALVPALAIHAQSTREQPHGSLDKDCGDCHSAERWTPVTKPSKFSHESTGFRLEGAHGQASCRGCHGSLVFNHVGTACADCHKDVHRGELGSQCESCHVPASWTNETQMRMAHGRTRLPLFATHARLDCVACHRSQRPYQYATTPAECGNCHLSTYLATSNPVHSEAGFSRRCEDCHSVTAASWSSSVFAHPATFSLSGGHSNLACSRCHGAGKPHAVAATCFSCHEPAYIAAANPSHTAAGFPRTCEDCHTSASWRPAKLDHSATRFPLTGAHTRTECVRCHLGGRYAGTPTACSSCHQPDYARTTNPNHQAAGFPITCESCHSTSAWRPASFDHDGRYFPIYSGKHRGRWSSCSDCHVSPGNYRAFECILCHEHSNRTEVDRKHREVTGYAYQSAACYRCHSRGSADSLGAGRPLP